MATIAGTPNAKAAAERRFYCWMAIGLMALVFYSSRRGYDDAVNRPFDETKS